MKNPIKTLVLSLAMATVFGCSKSKDPIPFIANYFLGIESAIDPAVDVLSPASAIDAGTISPVNNGFEQPVQMNYIQGKNELFTTGKTSSPEVTKYELVDGVLKKGGNFFTDTNFYAFDVVDESTIVFVGAPSKGFSDKKLYIANTNTMTITKMVSVNFGNDEANGVMSFPVDSKVRGDKLFVAYYMISADGRFSTPNANQARVAVFSYPSLKFEKIITDDRAPNIGKYLAVNSLEIDEKGDIYTFSPSSLACGYSPVPEKNSGILRIKKGETAFDPAYHIDFETLSGGYKINNLFYVGNGKAVVRVLKEDENDLKKYLWAAHSPTSKDPLLETGIVDLYNKSFTLLSNVPKGGGAKTSAFLVEGTKLYLGISNSSYAGIYVIDTESNTATKGATVDGNYSRGILALYK